MGQKQKQSLGQVFIKDKNIIDKIITSAQLCDTDAVCEIGCGEGWLSLRLAEMAGSLDIIELDERFMAETAERLAGVETVTFHQGDVLKVGFSGIRAEKFKVVANIPYYISAKIMQLLVANMHRLDRSLVMVQKEFAYKLLAKPGDKAYTSLAVYVQAHFDLELAFLISKNSFRPVPKVDSAMLVMQPKYKLPDHVDADVFFKLVNAAFWGRRKTLLNCIEKSPHLQLSGSPKNFPYFKERSEIRGENLSLADFLEVYEAILPLVC